MSETKASFDAAVERSKSLPSQPNNIKLDLYSLFKQGSSGDVTGSRPGMFDPVGRAKWDAWDKRKGMSKDAAMEAYIALIDKLED
jgi:acyl-CoA-binding protein